MDISKVNANSDKYKLAEVELAHEAGHSEPSVLNLMASLDPEIEQSLVGRNVQPATQSDIDAVIPQALGKIKAAITWRTDSHERFNWRGRRLKALDDAVDAYKLSNTEGNESAEMTALQNIKEKIDAYSDKHAKSRKKAISNLREQTEERLTILMARANAKAKFSEGERVRQSEGSPLKDLENQTSLSGEEVSGLKKHGFRQVEELRLQRIESGEIKGAAAKAVKEISKNLNLIEQVTLEDPGRLEGIAKSMAQACERIEAGMAKRIKKGKRVKHSTRLSSLASQARQRAEFLQSRVAELKRPIVEKRIANGLLGTRRDKRTYIGAAHTALTGAKGNSYELLNTVSQREAQTLGVGQFAHEITEKGAKLVVGEGGGGKVRLARDLNTGELCAVKKIKLNSESSLSSASLEEVYSEVKLQEAASETPGVVPVSDYVMTKDSKGADTVYVFLPLIKINDNYFHEIRALDSDAQQEALRGKALEALRMFSDLHAHKIYHRDIKLDNMIVDEQNRLHVIDFGLASRSENVEGYDGTAAYLAPEVHGKAKRSDVHSAAKADAWALGITLYEMATGKRPMGLSDSNNSWDCQRLVETEIPDLSLIKDPALKHVIEGLLIKDPSQRMSIANAHAYLSEA